MVVGTNVEVILQGEIAGIYVYVYVYVYGWMR